jgi:hypothetical protein
MSNKRTDQKAQHIQNKKDDGQYKGHKTKYNKRNTQQEEKINYYMIPIFILLCIVPLLIRVKIYNPNIAEYNWAPNIDNTTDYFLFYKHWFVIITAAIMIIIIAYKAYKRQEKIKLIPIFVPLCLYAILSLLSAIFSVKPIFSFLGSFDQFESVFALLGYCIIAYYSFLFIKTERNITQIIYFLTAIAFIFTILGITQFSGHDFLSSGVGYRLVTPPKYQVEGAYFRPNFANSIYLTLYNPNYVGVYVSLITPIIAIMTFFIRNKRLLILSLMALVGLIFCAIGSKSLAGIIGLVIAFICILLFMWRYLLKWFKIVIPVAVVAIIGVVIINAVIDNMLINKVKEVVQGSKPKYELTAMDTNDDNVSLIYKGNKLYVQYIGSGEGAGTFLPQDESGQLVSCSYDEATNTIRVNDDRFAGISFGVDQERNGVFFIEAEGFRWSFSNLTEDGTYYHVNRMGRLDKMVTAPSAVFNGYEWFATARGYIWSRTIPTLKDKIILGSGPDTFVLTFPQQDYINFERYGYGNGIMTKPHSLYLQIWSQTGLISLLAFLTFYLMYFISSFRLYIKGRFHNIYAQMGLAIFIGTIGYMVTGLTNDSSITTAPMFWLLIGTGIAMNQKAKQLILEEASEYDDSK